MASINWGWNVIYEGKNEGNGDFFYFTMCNGTDGHHCCFFKGQTKAENRGEALSLQCTQDSVQFQNEIGMHWKWVWASSGKWWRTGKPGMLQSMRSQIDMTEQLNNIWSYMHCTAFIASHYALQSFVCSATALENVYAVLPIIFRFGSPGKNSETTWKYPCETLFPLKSWPIGKYWFNEQK